MKKYDDASWHYGGDFPADLPGENGATHIGLFLAWAIDNNLLSAFQLEESAADVSRVLKREITGRDFLLANCDGKLTEEDLNEPGNSFASDYYEDESEFAQKTASYLKDFTVAAEYYFREFGLDFESVYHIEDNWEFYEVFRVIIDTRFEQWKAFRSIP
jgi:hypothetical protein